MSEPAVHRESAIQGERADYRESTVAEERAVRRESTDNNERVASWASVWNRTPAKPKVIAAVVHAALDRDDDVACLAGLLRSTNERRRT